MDPSTLESAAQAIHGAKGLLIVAGAGMGADSGLPDFRGPEGSWRAYPAFHKLGLRFERLAQPHWFDSDPELAWGFYGHRLCLYHATSPHAGFTILRRWGESKPACSFVVTSNVDGHFQRGGFPEDRVHEVHGSISLQQGLRSYGVDVNLDESTMRARPPLPTGGGSGTAAGGNERIQIEDAEGASSMSRENLRRRLPSVWSMLLDSLPLHASKSCELSLHGSKKLRPGALPLAVMQEGQSITVGVGTVAMAFVDCEPAFYHIVVKARGDEPIQKLENLRGMGDSSLPLRGPDGEYATIRFERTMEDGRLYWFRTDQIIKSLDDHRQTQLEVVQVQPIRVVNLSK